MKINKKNKQEIIDDLYTIIEINRVGSDEIDFIENIISDLEKLKIKDITTEVLLKVSNEINDLPKWSDRLGSDELYLINKINKYIKTFC